MEIFANGLLLTRTDVRRRQFLGIRLRTRRRRHRATDAKGNVYLYLPNGTYSFTANGKSYAATVADGPATATAQ